MRDRKGKREEKSGSLKWVKGRQRACRRREREKGRERKREVEEG